MEGLRLKRTYGVRMTQADGTVFEFDVVARGIQSATAMAFDYVTTSYDVTTDEALVGITVRLGSSLTWEG